MIGRDCRTDVTVKHTTEDTPTVKVEEGGREEGGKNKTNNLLNKNVKRIHELVSVYYDHFK